MQYYKRHLGDYAKKAGRLSMLQHGAYTLLLDSCYDREEFPTLEQAIEWTWASTPEEKQAVEFVLSKFFTLHDGIYIQSHIQEVLNEYHAKSETNARIAIEREAKRREKNTNRAPDVHEPPPNHKPLTINQEPLTINQEPLQALGTNEDSGNELDCSASLSKKVPSKTGTRLPEDWVLPKSWGEWALTMPGWTTEAIRLEGEIFKDYWTGVPGARGRKINWLGTWKNRIRSQNPKANGRPVQDLDALRKESGRQAKELLFGKKNEQGVIDV
jgi:uncharacterized protein YdaU (DUF1376 family)